MRTTIDALRKSDANPFDSLLAAASLVFCTHSLDAIRALKIEAAKSNGPPRTTKTTQRSKRGERHGGEDERQEGTVNGPQGSGRTGA